MMQLSIFFPFKEFLKTHLETNVGMISEKAEGEAQAIIANKREISDGDYAIVEDDDEIQYYYRKKKKWVIDKS